MVESLNQRRVKALTPFVTGAALAALLLHNWGEGTVFSGIRPALKSVFNRTLGGQPPQPASSDDSKSRS
jgi:hypothetical protein